MKVEFIGFTDQFGKKIETYHGANCVGIHGTVVLTPDQARQLAGTLLRHATEAERLAEKAVS